MSQYVVISGSLYFAYHLHTNRVQPAMTPDKLHRLAAYFAPEDLEWKPITLTKDRKKALVATYVDNRAVMDRLDNVCGPENWRNEYQPGPDGGILCGLSIRITFPDGRTEWITKWDGAENTDVEAVKGGLSGSMRRAAVHWGIGRYLYNFPQAWVPVDERGRFTEPPRVPSQYLPPAGLTPQEKRQLWEAAQEAGHDEDSFKSLLTDAFGSTDLTPRQFDRALRLVTTYTTRINAQEEPS